MRPFLLGQESESRATRPKENRLSGMAGDFVRLGSFAVKVAALSSGFDRVDRLGSCHTDRIYVDCLSTLLRWQLWP